MSSVEKFHFDSDDVFDIGNIHISIPQIRFQNYRALSLYKTYVLEKLVKSLY